jgi:hypothetical protein
MRQRRGLALSLPLHFNLSKSSRPNTQRQAPLTLPYLTLPYLTLAVPIQLQPSSRPLEVSYHPSIISQFFLLLVAPHRRESSTSRSCSAIRWRRPSPPPSCCQPRPGPAAPLATTPNTSDAHRQLPPHFDLLGPGNPSKRQSFQCRRPVLR